MHAVYSALSTVQFVLVASIIEWLRVPYETFGRGFESMTGHYNSRMGF